MDHERAGGAAPIGPPKTQGARSASAGSRSKPTARRKRGPEKRARASGARATIDEVGGGGGGDPQPMGIGTVLARHAWNAHAPHRRRRRRQTRWVTQTQLNSAATNSRAMSLVAAYERDNVTGAGDSKLIQGTESLSFGGVTLSFGSIRCPLTSRDRGPADRSEFRPMRGAGAAFSRRTRRLSGPSFRLARAPVFL